MPAESLVQRYRDQLQKLLPPGRALNRRLNSFLTEWLASFAVEFARIHERNEDMVREAYPGDAVELLADWETLVGLPDECSYGATTDEQRQAEVLSHFAVNEGQSLADFQSIATVRGYPSLTMGTYGTFRTGVHSIGHKPLYSDEWLSGSRVSYEVASPPDAAADASLECALLRHAHAHTQMNFNGYNANDASFLTGLTHQFMPGDFTEADDVITAWTNTSTGYDWVQNQVDALTSYVLKIGGWDGVGGWDETGDTPLQLGGLNVRTDGNETSATLVRSNNFVLYIAGHLTGIEAGSENVLVQNTSRNFMVSIRDNGASFDVRLRWGTQTLDRAITTPTFVITAACNGTNIYLRVNEETSATVAIAGSVSEEPLVLGDATPGGGYTSYHGSIFEIIAAEYGLITTSPELNVTLYLTSKYL